MRIRGSEYEIEDATVERFETATPDRVDIHESGVHLMRMWISSGENVEYSHDENTLTTRVESKAVEGEITWSRKT